jgi:hypothetical protein
MNARIERSINSESLDARIMRNRALDQKIWALESFRGKTVCSGGFGVIREFLEWLEGLGTKDTSSCEFWGFLWSFGLFRVV